MAAQTRIYTICDNSTGVSRLVRASHPSHALMHVARDIAAVKVASQDDLVQCVGDGIQIEPSEGAMLDAVREVIDPNCRGFGFSANGILPRKHSLGVTPTRLSPKEGYGNFLGDIAVPTS